ncbi:unnamed protein product [Macrosiphum euphorbiae]|uniref:Uncharacterized protein n=1 Tax=Macrosiphum euphorbiae TaxID=13131 RepID=A0AAV0VZM9_9HEMI|nr:unnamed protein product [Macrosiphum euphorbiae]
MGDKKTVYTFPIFFGENCYIGDKVFGRQHLQNTDRSDAAVTEVAVTQCDRRCSHWTPFHSAPADEPAGNDSKIELGGGNPVGPAKSELGGGNSVGPAKSDLGSGNPVGPAKSELGNSVGPAKSELGGGNPVDAMGPLNIMAAVIPFECTWSTAAADVDNLSWKSGSSFEIQFDDDDDDDESGESDNK